MKLKNKHGFTLIELLAVIVVLAIIALIATPIVMKTIKNAKKEAAERSADGYIRAAETTVFRERLNGHVLEGEYEITENGNICENKQATCGDSREIEIAATGRKPKGGKLMIIKGEVSISSSIDMGDYVVSYDKENNKYETTKKGSASAETLCTKKDGVDLANLTYGNEFTCHLDSDRTFYVLETSEDNVTLIMDRNFTDDTVPKTIPWCIDGGENGEVCKNINSEEEGTPLKHIQDTFGTNVKVSFPTVSQIETASGKTIDNSMISGLPTWLYNYLAYNTTHKISDVYGYWTASYHASDKYGVWAVNCDGDFFVYGVVSMSEGYSIRPIITISKSDLC